MDLDVRDKVKVVKYVVFLAAAAGLLSGNDVATKLSTAVIAGYLALWMLNAVNVVRTALTIFLILLCYYALALFRTLDTRPLPLRCSRPADLALRRVRAQTYRYI